MAIDSAVSGVRVRALGSFSKKKEIEAIVVDDELGKGYIILSDQQANKFHLLQEKELKATRTTIRWFAWFLAKPTKATAPIS